MALLNLYGQPYPSSRRLSAFIFLIFHLLLGIYAKDSIVDPHTSRRNLTKGIEEAEAVVNLIHFRYEMNNHYRKQFFLAAGNMPDFTWDILKYKFAIKMLANGIENTTFLMIFGGSSVTAGHDNFYNQSWPFVFERRMKPLFEAVGVTLKVHNIAQGANNCRPSNLCYEAMGGLPGIKADFIGWEQSFNCGRDAGIFELMARTAAWNKGVVYYHASGAFSQNGCKPSTDKVPWSSPDWKPEMAGITQFFKLTQENLTAFRNELNLWNQNGDSVDRFVGPLKGRYKGVGPHGFSVWAKNRLCVNDLKNFTGHCSAVEVVGKCLNEGGSHWMVEEATIYGHDSGKGAGHHPPVSMHQMRGEHLAYNYAHIFADAMVMLQTDLLTKTEDVVLQEYEKKLEALQIPVPDPEKCKTECHCRGDCEEKPSCFTNYQPHHNTQFLLDSVIVGNHTGWASVYKEGSGGHVANFQKYGYQDHRPCYEARSPNAEIHVKVTIKNIPFIRVCGYSQKESLKHAHFFLDPNITNPGPDYTPTSNRYKITTKKYVNDECTQLNNLPTGNHVVTISTDPLHPNHLSSFTHLILFGV